MGKKSLIKSTSKKRAPKKASASRKPKKKAPAKKAAAKGVKPAAKAKAAPVTAKKAIAKKQAAKAKPVAVKDLLKKQFDSPAPENVYRVPADMIEKSTFTAPERLAGYSDADAKRIRGLLANTYSAEELKAVAKEPVSREELIKKQFQRETPASLYTVPGDMVDASTFTAPALLDGYGDGDAKRIKGLLANAYSEKDLIAAAEKAAAEKAAAEKAAAEKAAAEKAAAEKAAAEKAAAEKAAAEKAAAEKAAAEKAAAEKAAAEKAAAEKAANEKAALEKAEAIKKAAAQKSEVEVSYESKPAQTPSPKPAKPQKPSDPVDNTVKLIAAGVAFFLLLVIGASISNSTKYYLADNQGALEIWKGKFAPLGKKMVVALPGVPAPETILTVYSADDVNPLAFNYYIDKADALLGVSGIPDFEEIKATLKTALEYASTRDLKTQAYARLDTIDRIILVYKADVIASRGTIEDLTAAIGFLEGAAKLTADETEKGIIEQKITAHESAITRLEEQAAAEQAALEAEAAAAAEAEELAEADEASTTNEEAAAPETESSETAPEESHEGH